MTRAEIKRTDTADRGEKRTREKETERGGGYTPEPNIKRVRRTASIARWRNGQKKMVEVKNLA